MNKFRRSIHDTGTRALGRKILVKYKSVRIILSRSSQSIRNCDLRLLGVNGLSVHAQSRSTTEGR